MKNRNLLLHACFWLCPIFFVSDLICSPFIYTVPAQIERHRSNKSKGFLGDIVFEFQHNAVNDVTNFLKFFTPPSPLVTHFIIPFILLKQLSSLSKTQIRNYEVGHNTMSAKNFLYTNQEFSQLEFFTASHMEIFFGTLPHVYQIYFFVKSHYS